jgi:hypothetical protein
MMIPVIQFLDVKEVGCRRAGMFWAKLAVSVERKQSLDEINHELPGGIRWEGNLQPLSHQKQMSQAQLGEIHGGGCIWTASI